MALVSRWDSSPLERFERTPTGGLRIPATPARVGIQIYRDADGTERREYRPPEEVFSDASLATFRHAVVTDLHPSQRGGSSWVTPETWRSVAVGHVGEQIGHTDTHVTCDVLLQDAAEIALVERGERRELSCGYVCDYDPTPGVTPEGEHYDGIQRNVRLNHVALLPPGAGRAGPSAALRLDAAEAWQDCGDGKPGRCAEGESPAEKASQAANAASANAKDHAGHKEAANAHYTAANEHAKAGNPEKAREHLAQETTHKQEAAKAWAGMSGQEREKAVEAAAKAKFAPTKAEGSKPTDPKKSAGSAQKKAEAAHAAGFIANRQAIVYGPKEPGDPEHNSIHEIQIGGKPVEVKVHGGARTTIFGERVVNLARMVNGKPSFAGRAITRKVSELKPTGRTHKEDSMLIALARKRLEVA